MKNVAIIITKLNGGGAERCASNLSIELAKEANVFLIVFDANAITYPYGGHLIDLRIPKSESAISRYMGVIRRAWQVRQIKKQYNIDVSISLLEGPNLVNVLSKWKEKTIVSVRNCMSKQNGGFIANAIIKYASKNADLTVSLSKMVGRDLVENYGIHPEKIVTIYNQVDKELLEKQKNDGLLSLNPIRNYIVTMGRMHPQKGQWHLVKAFSKVARECSDLDLLILGTGELELELKRMVETLGLQNRVIMPGFIKAPHSYLKRCEMFVLPSLYEGLGNVLLEAASFGLPIISTDCQWGPREILSPYSDLTKTTTEIEWGDFGVLVPVDNSILSETDMNMTYQEGVLADAIIKMHKDNQLRDKYSKKSAERAEQFSKKNIISEWMKLID